MRRALTVLLIAAAALIAASPASAVLVQDGSAGRFGIAVVPTVGRWSGLQAVTSPAPCQDPWLSSDFGGPLLPDDGLCYHGGSVVHRNEVFDITWDPLRRDWATTRYYVENFLRNVAQSSGSLGTPYAITPQYQDGSGRAENQSTYGGGCIDYGHDGGAACQFGDTTGNAAGTDYPTNGCQVTGTNLFGSTLGGSQLVPVPNDVCLTDAQVRSEVSTMVNQAGLIGRTQGGYTPLVVVMTPPGVVDCLDAADNVCSSNHATVPAGPQIAAGSGGTLVEGNYSIEITEQIGSVETVASSPVSMSVNQVGGASINVNPPTRLSGASSWSLYVAASNGDGEFHLQTSGRSFQAPYTLNSYTDSGAQPPTNHAFCSYHSYVTLGGVRVPYVVQPWTALTGCDEPDTPQITFNPPPSSEVLATEVGQRLVSPVSQGELAAITDPGLDGWYGLDGSEINDNGYPEGCVPLANQLDAVTVGSASYYLQREFNNGGAIASDPNALGCQNVNQLQAQFVAPTAVDPGDVVEFDGSKTVSSLLIPRANYAWSFGDGTSATGPSVVHTFAANGTYTVTLKVTDRGGATSTVSQTVQVGPPAVATPPPPTTSTTTTTTTTKTTTPSKPKKVTLKARLQLLPQSLHTVLHAGVAVRISSNLKADGLTTLSLSRADAKRAHLRVSRASTVIIGRGTLAGINNGTITVHVRIPRATVKRLSRLHRVTLMLRVVVRGPSRSQETIDVAGRY